MPSVSIAHGLVLVAVVAGFIDHVLVVVVQLVHEVALAIHLRLLLLVQFLQVLFSLQVCVEVYQPLPYH